MTLSTVPIPGFTLTKQPYEDMLADVLDIPDWTPELLGQSVQGRDVYGFSLGDPSKPVMWIEGNIHGLHEWRTCYWVAQFMRYISNPDGLPDSSAQWIEYLKGKYSFYFIPSVNPDGYENNTYANANGVNLNRNFDYMWENGSPTPGTVHYRGPTPFSEPEAQYVRDKFIELEPVAAVDTHSWGGGNGVAIVTPGEVSHTHLASTFASALRASYPLDAGLVNVLGRTNAGMAADWMGTRRSPLSKNSYGIVYESGDQLPDDIQTSMGMTGLLLYMLVVDRELSPKPLPLSVSEWWGPLKVGESLHEVLSVEMSSRHGLLPVWSAP